MNNIRNEKKNIVNLKMISHLFIWSNLYLKHYNKTIVLDQLNGYLNNNIEVDLIQENSPGKTEKVLLQFPWIRMLIEDEGNG